ncbi:tetratricopeptide repeat protein [Flavobacterium sp.]|uniref:tetratricopeptide repeat protein n=1 Tax=Flavobacterium sp. TaxID=239 RepID=UPI003528F8C7
MKKILVYIAILISNFVLAQNAAQILFEKANENYRQEKYELAASQYESILETQKVASAELYYNLGNAYYKLGKVAPAIFNLEKALLLNPNDEAIQTNLHFAQKMAIDDIKVVPEVGFSKLVYNFTSMFSYNTWAWISVTCAIAFLMFFIGYYFSSYTNIKRAFFVGMFVLLGVLFVSILSAYLQKRFDANIRPAIVFVESTFVKAEPKNSAENAFELHEGTKVYVKEELNNWKRIQLTDKTEGWVKKEAIKELKE